MLTGIPANVHCLSAYLVLTTCLVRCVQGIPWARLQYTRKEYRVGFPESLHHLHLCWPAFSVDKFLSWLPYSRPSEAAQDTRFKKYEDYMNVEEEVLKNQAALRMESKQVVMVRAHCGTSHPAYYRCPGKF